MHAWGQTLQNIRTQVSSFATNLCDFGNSNSKDFFGRKTRDKEITVRRNTCARDAV